MHVQRDGRGQARRRGGIAQPQIALVQFDRVRLAQEGQVAAATGNQAFPGQLAIP